MNFNEVNIHIAKVFLVFTYDEGQSWFETEMVKNDKDHLAILSNIPNQGNLIYFLKIIDVFDEEFIDNNNENYYTVSYVCPPDPDSEKTKASQKSPGIGPQDSDSITESGLEIETYNDSELEEDKSFDLNDSDLEMTAHDSIAKDEEDSDDEDEGALVENPFNIEMAEEDDDEGEEDDDFEKEIIKTGKIKAKPSDLEEDTDTSEDEIEFSKDGISDLEDLALHDDDSDSISKSGEFPSAEQTSFYLDRGGKSRLQTTGAKKITAPIKPIAPRKLSIDVDKDGNAIFTVGSDDSDNSSSTEEPMVPAEIAKPETAAGVFLKGAKKKAKRKEKHGSEEDTHDESDAEDEDQNAVSQQESREQKELLEKIFALSRYRAKKESEATSNNIYQVVSENVKLDKEMKKGKTDLAKFDKNGIPITPEQSEQVTNTLNMISLDGSSIKITHPFYEMMIETIKKNGSLAIPEITKTKTKEPKEIFKQCKKCEAKLAKEWKICPICGSKQ